jgi:hypothetical protein
MTVNVYAITNSRTVPEIAGLRAVRVGALTALVTDVRRPPAATTANLRKYHRTLAVIADATPATLPVRFGTTMSEPELAIILFSRATSLTATLRRVRGRVQMTLRLPGRSGAATRPPAKPVKSGREYLRTLAARERDIPGFDVVRKTLSPWIKEERIDRRGTIVSVYHLVARRSAAAYARRATAAMADAGLVVVVSGPFPPYAFGAL